MMSKKYLFVLIILFLAQNYLTGQLISNPEVSSDLTSKHWDAVWVKVPGSPAYDYGVYLFRNSIELDVVPENFIVHVTADNRYKLNVNGTLVGLGPARSDPDNWNYETYNLSRYLKTGSNIITAEVWNYGEFKPWAQLSLYTGFLVQGNSPVSAEINTPGSWKCISSNAYSPLDVDRAALGTFIIVGPGDNIDGSLYPWGWRNISFDDRGWQKPETIISGAPKGVGTDITHALVPRVIPGMELREINSPVIRKIESQYYTEPENMQISGFTVPANSSRTILLDQQELVTAYPKISLSGGKGSTVKLSYAEALYDESGRKQHRDSVENMYFKGNSDIFRNDGNLNRDYTTLWFRTFRYLLLEISTADEPITINSLNAIYTAYPLMERAYFQSSDPRITPIWDVAWRTARLCANELYYDCPYYEQMQYVGDTRIQSLISLYVSGDDRLMRKAINDYFNSITPEGLTLSRYPTEPRQVIPTFSLYWISMIHDFLWHRNDYMFAAKYLVSIQHILQWFENRIDQNTGMLGPIAYWPFVDWTAEWPWDNEKRIGGVPDGAQTGSSSIITLQFAMTLDQAADIFSFYGLNALATEYTRKADELIEATRNLCWDDQRELFADTPEKKSYSQHANTFAVLTNAIEKKDRAIFMEKLIRDKSLIQASIYFRFYLHRAAIESGLGNKYLTYLDPWERMVNHGLTTFAEVPDLEGTRSDCHAWSSSPMYELLHTVAGIRPASVGFESVIIEPHPGNLEWINAGMPHYLGEISVDLSFDKKGAVKGTLTVPPGLKGLFVWDQQTIDLVPGKQKVSLKSLDAKYPVR